MTEGERQQEQRDPLVLRFAVSRADIEAAVTRGAGTPSARSSLFWAVAIVAVGLLIRSNAAPAWMVWTCFALGGTLLTLTALVPLWVRWHWRRNRRLFEMCELRVDENGLVAIEEGAEAHMSWSAFVRWEETQDLFLLFRAPSYSVLIPKRAFETDGDLRAFRELLRRGVSGGAEQVPVESRAS